jgi:hypothetical protein
MSLNFKSGTENIVTPRMLIRGDAVGLGGFITKMAGQPAQMTIPVLGASALPVIGGISTDMVDELPDDDIESFVSFDSIETEAQGSYDPNLSRDRGKVTASATVNGLKLVNRFEAKTLQASLKREPTIDWSGTAFTGLTLDGHDIEVHIDAELAALTTEQALSQKYQDPTFYNQYHNRFFHGPNDQPRLGAPIPRLCKAKYIMFSIVERIVTKHPNAQVSGHVLTLEGFGAIRFGEVVVLQESRQLTLAQFQLGCADQGTVVACDVITKGETCPP